MFKLSHLAAIIACVTLGGCVNLYAGIAQYSVEPFWDPTSKKQVCCKVTVTSGKNAGSVIVHIVKNGDDFTVDLNEQQINSSSSISAATQSVSQVAKAVSDTADAVEQITKKVP